MSTTENSNTFIFEKRISVIIVFLLSGLVSLGILIVALWKKAYKTLISEFLMYIIIGELFNSIGKLLSLQRTKPNEPFEEFDLSWNKITQLYICLFADGCANFTILVISLKIYDGIVNNSRLFNNLKYVKLSRILIICFPIIFSSLLGSAVIIQYSLYTPIEDRPIYFERMCDYIACRPHKTIFLIECIIIVLCMIASFTITFMAISFLIRMKKELNDFKKYHSDTIGKDNIQTAITTIQASTGRLYVIPIISNIAWVLMMCVILGSVIGSDSANIQVKKFIVLLRYTHTTFDGIRGVLYSIILVLTSQEVFRMFCCCKCCRKLLKTTDDDRPSKIASDFSDTELNMYNLDNEL